MNHDSPMPKENSKNQQFDIKLVTGDDRNEIINQIISLSSASTNECDNSISIRIDSMLTIIKVVHSSEGEEKYEKKETTENITSVNAHRIYLNFNR